MSSINVDVDLDDMDDDDLVDEIIRRIENKHWGKMEGYREDIREALDNANITTECKLSVEDSMKIETFQENMSKKSLQEIRDFFS